MGFREVSHMPGYQGGFPNAWFFVWKFTKSLVFFGKFFGFLKFLLESDNDVFVNFRNFPNAWVFRKFPKFLVIWEISPMTGYLENIPNACFFGKFIRCPNFFFFKFLKCLGFREISQMPNFSDIWYLGNFPNDQVFGKFPILIFLNFSVTPSP